MSINNTSVIIGNLASPPTLRYTDTGQPVANLRVIVNDQWRDHAGDIVKRANGFNVVAWGSLAENVAASLQTGDRVIVTGEHRQRRTRINEEDIYFSELHASEIGAALRWATLPGGIQPNRATSSDPAPTPA